MLAAAVVVVAAAFALAGGEYSTLDWLELRRRERAERARLARLAAEVDSLERVARRVETDPRERERIAREQFGMIRPGEFLYRFVTPEAD